MANPYDEPVEPCPYCTHDMHADFADNGVGLVQCGPYHCENCGASEIGPELDHWYYKDRNGQMLYLLGPKQYIPYLKQKRQYATRPVLKAGHPFTEIELETGYYQKKHSPYANTVGGVIVNHKIAKLAYNHGALDPKDALDELLKNETEDHACSSNKPLN